MGKMGLSRQVAQTLAAQTVAGAAVMRDEIVSPAGTTSYANHQLEKGGFKNTIINAVEAATLRSIELPKMAASASSVETKNEESSEKQKNIEKLSEDLADKFHSLKMKSS